MPVKSPVSPSSAISLYFFLPAKRQCIRLDKYPLFNRTPGTGSTRSIVRLPKQREYLEAGITMKYRKPDKSIGVKFVDENIQSLEDLAAAKKKLQQKKKREELLDQIAQLKKPTKAASEELKTLNENQWPNSEETSDRLDLNENKTQDSPTESKGVILLQRAMLNSQDRVKLDGYISKLERENEKLRSEKEIQYRAKHRALFDAENYVMTTQRDYTGKLAKLQGLLLKHRATLHPKGVLDFICELYGRSILSECPSSPQDTLDLLYKDNEEFQNDVRRVIRMIKLSLDTWEYAARDIYFKVSELDYKPSELTVKRGEMLAKGDAELELDGYGNGGLNSFGMRKSLTKEQAAVIAGYMQHYKIKGKINFHERTIRVPF